MTLTQITNSIKKAIETKKDCTIPAADVATLFAALKEGAANKALVNEVLNILLQNGMDFDDTVEAVEAAYDKAGVMTVEKVKEAMAEKPVEAPKKETPKKVAAKDTASPEKAAPKKAEA